jgi:hypothetical protein
MAVLFVSHSSKDDALAAALETWLRANGFADLFVDHQHIIGGAKWREELRSAAAACRIVVCLVMLNWLASNECFNESLGASPWGTFPVALAAPRISRQASAARDWKRHGEARVED